MITHGFMSIIQVARINWIEITTGNVKSNINKCEVSNTNFTLVILHIIWTFIRV